MTDLRFDYGLLQELIDTFETTRSGFETLAGSTCPSCTSDDPVAEHHASTVKDQEKKLLSDAVTLYQNAKNGTQDAYDAFKAADGSGEGK